jgi:hypothetical protein
MTNGQPVTIEFSNRKRAFVLTIFAFAFIFAVWLVTTDSVEFQLDLFMAWSSVIVLGLVCVALLRVIFFGSKIGLRLTKTGLTSVFYSPDEIPWRFIIDLRSIKVRGTSLVLVELSPDASGKIRRNRFSRILNWPEFGPPGIYLSSSAFELSHDQLYTTLRDHWLATGAASIGPTGSKSSSGE